MKCPVDSVESIVWVLALTKLHRSIRSTSAMVVLNSTIAVLWVISNYMFSLTLPVHCCSIVFTDVKSSPTLVRNIASKADIYLGILLLVRKLAMLRERYRGVVKSSTYRSATTKCTDKVIRQTIWNYLQYYCLLNLTLQWRWQFWRNVILSVQVKAVGVLKVISTEITVFSVAPCSLADTAWDSNRP